MTSTSRRGPLVWLRALLGREPQAAAPLFESAEVNVNVNVPELTAVHQESTVAFETPAAGGGFDFQVEIRCEWCAEGRLDHSALSRAIDGYRSALPQLLTERVRAIAGRYEPFRVAEAEHAVNQELGKGECFENGLVRCRTTAFLRPAPEVLEQQRRAALELQEIEHRYAKSALQVRLLSEVSEQWRAFLAGGLAGVRPDDEASSWLTPWAVLLAEQPDKAATEVGSMFRLRQEHFDRYVKLLGRQHKEYEARDLFEFVAKNEQQLGQAMRLFGLSLPGEDGSGDGPAGPLPRPARN
ncbi:hypothetical protein ACFY12_19895 [Streptomyces sp. NPDC001339]|uniref:hypothetical protein n=1 Tax=Streptomyces sp. NPDC001339 TaxID=3364563 RepID=UPI00368208CF